MLVLVDAVYAIVVALAVSSEIEKGERIADQCVKVGGRVAECSSGSIEVVKYGGIALAAGLAFFLAAALVVRWIYRGFTAPQI